MPEVHDPLVAASSGFSSGQCSSDCASIEAKMTLVSKGIEARSLSTFQSNPAWQGVSSKYVHNFWTNSQYSFLIRITSMHL